MHQDTVPDSILKFVILFVLAINRMCWFLSVLVLFISIYSLGFYIKSFSSSSSNLLFLTVP